MALVNGTMVAMPAPPGWVVDLENPTRTLNPEVYWVYSIGMVLAFVFLLQRLFTKIVLMKTFQWDDACLVGAWLTSLATQIPAVYNYSKGNWGIHMWELPIPRLQQFLILIYIAPIVYAPCQTLAKLTLLLFYHRLSPVRSFKWAVNFTIFVVVGYNTAIMFSLAFACWPVRKAFDLTVTEGFCPVNLTQVYIATTVLGVITDLMVLVLPLPTVMRLQVSRAQKMGLVFIFGIGSVTFVTSVVRLVLLIPTIGNPDATWVIAQPTMWIGIEANLFIMCGSLPTLRKFAKHVGPKVFGSSFASKFSSHKPGGASSAAQRSGGASSKLKLSSGGKFSGTGGSRGGFDRLPDSRTDPDSLQKYGYELTVNGDRDGGASAGGRASSHGSDSERGIIEGNSLPRGIVQTRTTTVEYGPPR